MELKQYLRSLNKEQKQQLADEVGTSVHYLRHLAHGRRNAGHKLARKIQEASGHQVTLSELRPDIYPPE